MQEKHTSLAEFVRRLWLRGCTVQRIENILNDQYGCAVELETIRSITRGVDWRAAKASQIPATSSKPKSLETINHLAP